MTKGPTQGQQKLRQRFERFVGTDSFKTEVDRIRRVLALPKSREEMRMVDFWRKYDLETRALREGLPVQSGYLLRQLENYIFNNKFSPENLGDVCEIEDAQSELDQYEINEDPDSSTKSAQRHNDDLYDKLTVYPVSVRIHAEASQNDVVAFIKKNWGSITASQKSFLKNSRSSLKNTKTKLRKGDRNKFIFERSGTMSNKQLARLTNETFKGEDLDGNDVANIIRIEEKRRKV
jgi:hypothetical protein